MGWLEWFGESRNPGPVGRIDEDAPLPYVGSGSAIVFRAIIALGILIFAGWIASQADSPAWVVVFFLLYLGIAYTQSPKPATENMGVFGFIDHPLRWSDDANRILAVLMIILAPGRFTVAALRDGINYARGKRVIVLQRTVMDDAEEDSDR